MFEGLGFQGKASWLQQGLTCVVSRMGSLADAHAGSSIWHITYTIYYTTYYII